MKRSSFIYMLVFFISFITTTNYSQEKSKRELKKELKEKKKLEAQKITKELVGRQFFVFVPVTALPTGMRSINLTSNYFEVSFRPEIIESNLPFFGNASGSMAYSSNDNGINFKEKPEFYKIENIKDNYEIEAIVKDNFDTYNLYLSIGIQGNASLKVISNKRSVISYNGIISSIKDSMKNK